MKQQRFWLGSTPSLPSGPRLSCVSYHLSPIGSSWLQGSCPPTMIPEIFATKTVIIPGVSCSYPGTQIPRIQSPFMQGMKGSPTQSSRATLGKLKTSGSQICQKETLLCFFYNHKAPPKGEGGSRDAGRRAGGLPRSEAERRDGRFSAEMQKQMRGGDDGPGFGKGSHKDPSRGDPVKRSHAGTRNSSAHHGTFTWLEKKTRQHVSHPSYGESLAEVELEVAHGKNL